VRISHFEKLRPICPVCRLSGGHGTLGLNVVEQEVRGDVLGGILSCQACGSEFPIVDGMPIIVPDVRRFVQDNIFYLLARTDLTPAVESLLGDAAGPGSGLESIRQHVSSYVWDHWGDRDPVACPAVPGGGAPGAVSRNLAQALDLLGDDLPDGPVLDIGCAAGRTVTDAAERLGREVLGIDISVPLARCGRQAVVDGHIDYNLRRIGLVYDRRSYPLHHRAEGRGDVWICDALALPFSQGTFALAIGMNVVDCMRDPRAGLIEISRVLSDGGRAVFSVPFDWAGQVTPVEAWLGGHSQRSVHAGSPEAILDLLLSDGPLAAGALRRTDTVGDVPWHVRLHDRSCMYYSAYLVVARKAVG
jgi:SAM-dependent methyltransferase/uncharacterized protein YbaR (Trm112 family)